MPGGVPALQRSIGNRAFGRLVAERRRLQRKPLKTLLPYLPELAVEGRWDEQMRADLDALQTRFGDEDIGAFTVTEYTDGNVVLERPGLDDLLQNVGRAIGTGRAREQGVKEPKVYIDLDYGRSEEYRLVAYLLGGRESPPGVGSLGMLRFEGAELYLRPGFSTRILQDRAGRRRRGGTSRPGTTCVGSSTVPPRVATGVGERDRSGAALPRRQSGGPRGGGPPGRRAPARVLRSARNHQPGARRKVMKAAFVMNSRTENLWPGHSKENSEINTVSGSFQRAIRDFGKSEDIAELRAAVTKVARVGRRPPTPSATSSTSSSTTPPTPPPAR